MTDYAIMVEPLSEADGSGWLASVPALPCCMGDGETPEEALAGAECAIEEWVEAANTFGPLFNHHTNVSYTNREPCCKIV